MGGFVDSHGGFLSWGRNARRRWLAHGDAQPLRDGFPFSKLLFPLAERDCARGERASARRVGAGESQHILAEELFRRGTKPQQTRSLREAGMILRWTLTRPLHTRTKGGPR